nr:DUF4232 domain-containing protein [Nocardioides daejeonensis]
MGRSLRVEASVGAQRDACGERDVRATVRFVDAALGHRFARLRITNESQRTCSVGGYPGVGALGDQGSIFHHAVEQREPLADGDVTTQPIRLMPGAAAVLNLEWTGELAGAQSEWIRTLVIQLALGQGPLGISLNAPGDEQPWDIGIITTVNVGPWQSAANS